MTVNEMFITATRQKLRFPYKGLVSVEDLWDMSVHNLDMVYKALKSEEKQNAEESLLSVRTAEDTILEVKLEIVKYIVSIKIAEAEAKKHQAEIAAERRRINEIIANKRDAALERLSIEELEKKLLELQ